MNLNAKSYSKLVLLIFLTIHVVIDFNGNHIQNFHTLVVLLNTHIDKLFMELICE
jgi:hypothetical protein